MNVLLLGEPAKKFVQIAASRGHQIFFVSDKLSKNFLIDNEIQFVVSYGYRYIIKSDCIEWMQGKMVNLHISLLPWNRGADPNLWSFLKSTPAGVTIHQIDTGLDTGKILLQRKVIHDLKTDTLTTSYAKLTHVVEDLFLENFDALLAGTLKERDQIGVGSYQKSSDKEKYLSLLDKQGWDTPVSSLIGKAL